MADTLRKTRRYFIVFLLFSCFFLQAAFFPVSAADFSIKLSVPERVEFYLSTDFVDLDPPHTQNNITYYENKNAVRLNFRSNITSRWEIYVTGTDFTTGEDCSFDISRLQWRTKDTAYHHMPPAGEYAMVACGDNAGNDVGKWQRMHLSYYLELEGDEYEGPYTAIITYTFFVP